MSTGGRVLEVSYSRSVDWTERNMSAHVSQPESTATIMEPLFNGEVVVRTRHLLYAVAFLTIPAVTHAQAPAATTAKEKRAEMKAERKEACPTRTWPAST